MRKIIGEYNLCLKKLYDSFRKRFSLKYEDTLEEVDNVFLDKDFSDYPIIFISNDDTYSMEFISELNDTGNVKAYGFYDRGNGPYMDVIELREKIKLIMKNSEQLNMFFYVSVSIHSVFRLDIPGTICIKQGRNIRNLSLDILKTRMIIENERFRKAEEADYSQFSKLYKELSYNRWEKCPEFFDKNWRINSSEFGLYNKKSDTTGIYVYEKNSEMVGFIIFDNVSNVDGFRTLGSSSILIRDIFVVKEFRRCGIGKRMYEEVVKIVRKRAPYKIKFRVWDFDDDMKYFISSLQSKLIYSLYELDS